MVPYQSIYNRKVQHKSTDGYNASLHRWGTDDDKNIDNDFTNRMYVITVEILEQNPKVCMTGIMTDSKTMHLAKKASHCPGIRPDFTATRLMLSHLSPGLRVRALCERSGFNISKPMWSRSLKQAVVS